MKYKVLKTYVTHFHVEKIQTRLFFFFEKYVFHLMESIKSSFL